jgi:tRNA-splicing ligase RtcB
MLWFTKRRVRPSVWRSSSSNCRIEAWLEEHDGQQLWVVRKGATPAFPGQRGFVGGSMGDISVIVEGVDSDEAVQG